jgi:hypothetical protein
MEAVTESQEYKDLDDETRKMVNGVIGLLEMGVVPPTEMALTVVMTAVGVTLSGHEKFQELADGGIWHVKGTNSLVMIMSGWVFKFDAQLVGDIDSVDLSDLEPM